MSLKHAVQKLSDNQYVLPKVGSMKVDAHAFLSEALYEGSEEKVWQQIAGGASYEGVIGAYLMPDTHTGYGVPVGSVIVTEDTIIQGGSGYDISCGVLYMKADLNAGSVRSKHERGRWAREVERRIATGKGHHRPDRMPKFSRPGRRHPSPRREGHRRQRRRVRATVHPRARRRRPDEDRGGAEERRHAARERRWREPLRRDAGRPRLGGGLRHGPLRQPRLRLADRQPLLPRGREAPGLPKNRREDSWLRADEPLGKEYWAHHNSAANFAVANRHIIVDGIRAATQEFFGADVEVYYEISHNLVQEETLVLPDGTTKKGFVHRKGATRAFPAGHPDLAGTRWESTGHPCLIPGSMYEGAAILFPLPGAHKSACSVNHGSGRLLARGEAKRKLEHKQQRIDDEMATVHRTFAGVAIEGIVGNHRHVPLDECAHVYKDLDEVLAVLEVEGIARVARRLYPVANIKGAD
jgi:tRNA-splicing ligase RtcB